MSSVVSQLHTREAEGRLVEVSDPLVRPRTRLVGRVSIYRAQTELLLQSVRHLGHVAGVRIPVNSFVRLSLKQRINKVDTHRHKARTFISFYSFSELKNLVLHLKNVKSLVSLVV